jgi:hypothetical protein
MWGYAAYSIFIGEIRVAARSSDYILYFEKTPLLFVVAVLFFVFGGAFSYWMGNFEKR